MVDEVLLSEHMNDEQMNGTDASHPGEQIQPC